MKWKDKILKQKEQGRIPEQYFGLVLANVEQAIDDYKLEIITELQNLRGTTIQNKYNVTSESYVTRLETIQEILNLINK